MPAPAVLRLDVASHLSQSHLNALLHDVYPELRRRRRGIALPESRSGSASGRLLSMLDEAGVSAGPIDAAEVSALSEKDEARAPQAFRDASVWVAEAAPSHSWADDTVPWTPPELASCAAGRLKIVLLGLGTVGLGVYRHLADRPDLFEILRIVVREPAKHSQDGVPAELLS